MSKIAVAFALSCDCIVYVTEELLAVEDAFSLVKEIKLQTQKSGGRYLTNCRKLVEQVSGDTALTSGNIGDAMLVVAFAPQVELSYAKTDNGGEIEGVVQADVLLKSEDGGYKKNALSLPFLFPVREVADEAEVSGIVSGLTVRKKSDGGILAEATLKISLKTYKILNEEYVCGIEEIGEIEDTDSALCIFAPKQGEDLWQVAKRLKQSPQEVEKCNPKLRFPIEKGEKIFIYRQSK